MASMCVCVCVHVNYTIYVLTVLTCECTVKAIQLWMKYLFPVLVMALLQQAAGSIINSK